MEPCRPCFIMTSLPGLADKNMVMVNVIYLQNSKKKLTCLSLKHTTNTCEHVRELVPGIYNRNQNERFIRICCILLHLFIG